MSDLDPTAPSAPAPTVRPVLRGLAFGFFWACMPAWLLLVVAADVIAPGVLLYRLALAFFAVVGLVPLSLALASRSARARRAVVLALAAYPVIALVPWTPRKRFVLAVELTRPGTTVEELEERMAEYTLRVVTEEDGTGRLDSLYGGDRFGGADRIHTYAWCDDDGRYDADLGKIYSLDGVVVGARFLPD